MKRDVLFSEMIVWANRDWTEDFTHENGCYTCRCAICQSWFTGHKRRNVCKICATEVVIII